MGDYPRGEFLGEDNDRLARGMEWILDRQLDENGKLVDVITRGGVRGTGRCACVCVCVWVCLCVRAPHAHLWLRVGEGGLGKSCLSPVGLRAVVRQGKHPDGRVVLPGRHRCLERICRLQAGGLALPSRAGRPAPPGSGSSLTSTKWGWDSRHRSTSIFTPLPRGQRRRTKEPLEESERGE